MADDKPFGWRAPTDQQIADWRAAGFDDATIEELTANNVYRPVEGIVFATEIGVAMLRALGRRFPGFIQDVRDEMAQRVVRLEASDDVHDAVEAPIVRDLLENRMAWDELIAELRDGDGRAVAKSD